MSVRSLREYIEAYGISKGVPFVEKSDLVNTILEANITEYNEQVAYINNDANVRYFGRAHRGFEIGIGV